LVTLVVVLIPIFALINIIRYMDNIYLLMLAALIILAVADLVVGVSNDAVNFLNSAIGSKALSFKTILIVASLGVFVGAVTSSGMMEIARSGIFVPEKFYFSDIMIIFLSVMIVDILLLDFFNTLGLPTSTTVSIVFELLGAAVMMSFIKVAANGDPVIAVWDYINTSKATEVISGIFLSIFIAFSIGALVQFLSRLVFTFHYQKKMRAFGAIFGGVTLTTLGYFIVIKGLKSTPYYTGIADILENNGLLALLISFVVLVILSQLFMTIFKRSILIVVIAVGTFGLALAFAGNDLVNFIGVPLAALSAYEAWSVSGVAADVFTMEVLQEEVTAHPTYLFLAGGIMVLTLWFSKKSMTVTQTELDLSSQGSAEEKFKPNFLSRQIVSMSTSIADGVNYILPKKTRKYIDSRFVQPDPNLLYEKSAEKPAFDMIRASINLSVAGILISIATSYKLPLSTTYVTFMVAMGTSLADRAWGRDDAVYRIAGVLKVIAGWFVTAIIAFTAAAICAYLIYIGGEVMVAILLLMVVLLLTRSYLSHKKKTEPITSSKLKKTESKTVQGIIEESADNIVNVVSRSEKIYRDTLRGLVKQDKTKLKKSRKGVKKLNGEVDELRDNIFYFIKNLDETSVRGSNFYIIILGCLTDIANSLNNIARDSYKYVNNNHKALRFNQIKDLQEINQAVKTMLDEIHLIFTAREFDKIDRILEQETALLNKISEKIAKQISRTRKEESSPRNTTLYFSILLESKDLVKAYISLLEEYHTSYRKKP